MEGNIVYEDFRIGDIQNNPCVGDDYHSDRERIEVLKGSITKVGWLGTLTVAKYEGNVFLAEGGHKRKIALMELYGVDFVVTCKVIPYDEVKMSQNATQEKLCGLYVDKPYELVKFLMPIYDEAVTQFTNSPETIKDYVPNDRVTQVKNRVLKEGKIGHDVFAHFIEKKNELDKLKSTEYAIKASHKAIELIDEGQLDVDVLQKIKNYNQMGSLIHKIKEQKGQTTKALQNSLADSIVTKAKSGKANEGKTGAADRPKVDADYPQDSLLSQAKDITASLRSAIKSLKILKQKKNEFRACSQGDALWKAFGKVQELVEEIANSDDSDRAVGCMQSHAATTH